MNIEELKNIKFGKDLCAEKLRDRAKTITELENLKLTLGNDDIALEKIERAKNNVSLEILDLLDTQSRLERMIDKIPQPHRTVLYYRYFMRYDYNKIAQLMNYSDKRIYQLHSQAIAMFSNL